ncbi:MAG: restriction endonuclease subunit S [Clostridia bacterium]|nr:restriction endonuclease subunit S [Clostridia bacterium]
MEYRLGDLYEVSNGLSKSGDCFGTGFPFLSFSTVFNNYFIPDEIKDLVQSSDKEQRSYSIKAGDVFITRTSETANELGMSCVALKDYPKATYNGFCKRLRPITENTYPLYMGYYFRTAQFRANFLKVASLITRASLRNEDLLKFKVDLPDIETQKKIASVLSNYDNLIENNNKRIAILEQMAENLYKEWFVRFRFPGYETAEFENGIPVGWEYKKINEMFDTSSGGTPSRSNPEYYDGGTIGWIKTGELLDSLIIDTEEHITSAGLQNSAAKLIPVGALLCSMYAGVGKLGITTKEISCSQATCVFMPKSYVSNIFMFHFLKLNKKYLENISFGAAQQNISQVIINKIKFLVPTKELVLEYDKRVESIYKQIYTIMLKNKNLIEQRDLLLPRLMSGKLEV